MWAQVSGEVRFELTPKATRVFQPEGRACGKALRLAGTRRVLGRKKRPASIAGKELGEGKQGEIRLWRFEQIIQDFEGQRKQVKFYSKCEGQPCGGWGRL